MYADPRATSDALGNGPVHAAAEDDEPNVARRTTTALGMRRDRDFTNSL
jgi:hypothetical protein